MENTASNDIKQDIIQAALLLIGKQGNINTPVRDIADEAGVNAASINYYFQSKDNLLNEMENYFAGMLSVIEKLLDDETMPPKVRIITWADKLMDLFFDYPGIILMTASKVIENKKIGNSLSKHIYNSDKSIISLVTQITGIKDENMAAMKAIQIASGMVYPIILQFCIIKENDINFNNHDIRMQYINTLVDSLLVNQ